MYTMYTQYTINNVHNEHNVHTVDSRQTTPSSVAAQQIEDQLKPTTRRPLAQNGRVVFISVIAIVILGFDQPYFYNLL